MTARTNRYPAPCHRCGQTVPAGSGLLGRDGERWVAEHDGDCPTGEATSEPPTEEFAPTDEQVHTRDLFNAGHSMVIEAGAGTGKTSTLRLLAAAAPGKRIQYVAFNKAIVTDVAGSMPPNVKASTAHSLAFQAVGKHYSKRLGSGRMRSSEIAHRLGVDPITVSVGETSKTLSADYLGGLVMRSVGRFCQTADDRPTRRHVPYIDGIDKPRDDGSRRYENNNAVAAEIEPAIERAWADLSRIDGQLPFRHDHYLKIWQLSHPTIDADVILFDEAQDANPVMAAVVAEQVRAQRVYVGDASQAIYEFTGAVNSIEEMRAEGLVTATLSQSFRFGQPIADVANEILARLDATLTLRGTPAIESQVGEIVDDPDAILTRTNAAAIDAVLAAQERGVRAHLVGGGSEVAKFAKGARELQQGGSTSHPELACFRSWNEVVVYVEQDEQGDELKLMVDLVERYGVETILKALDQMPREVDADLVISTAHKSKGREWDRVRLAPDFVKVQKDGPPSPSELRLQYVACTRAKRHLDRSVLSREEP